MNARRKKKPKGFICPNCNVRLVVHNTKTLTSGLVVRKRKCPLCPYRVKTDERVRPTRSESRSEPR